MRIPVSRPATEASAFAASLFAAVLLLAPASPAEAGAIVPCNGQCVWSIEVGDQSVASGEYLVDGETGDISIRAPVLVDLGDGASVGIGNLFGNADPILGFAVSASTGAIGKTFSFSFSLPVALSGPIDASSSISYSLTGTTAAGAQIAPLIGSTVLIARQVDSTPGGLAALDKGVNAGAAFFFLTGPQTQNSPVYTATNSFTGNLAYDLMSATVAFSLSPNSNVGVSGFVPQLPVPLPAAGWLLVCALAGAAGTARRRPLAADMSV